ARLLERALYDAYFSWALGQLREHDPQERLVRASIRQHIDQLNLLAVLTSIRSRGGAPGSSPGESAAALEPLPRGMLDGKELAEIAACRTLEDAFDALADTYLGTGVEKGILTYGQSQSLGEMQRFLEAVAVENACRLFRQDLLGAAVPLGFLWRKYSECVNLRLLARGAIFRMPPDAVRRELLLV
ncbi:MAG TPA: V-type ATPase subunit, partial [Spirochaetia bacterium]|nr:V-type ATPase subunit [Spirochaetia bacterium]